MENASEMIRQQMTDTRTALSDKLEMLERQVVHTVLGVSAAVTETVESVKEVAQETAQTVGDSVQESVKALKDTFDLKHQVSKRPWTMVAGAAALGYLSSFLVRGSRAGHAGDTGRRPRTPVAAEIRASVARNGATEMRHSTAGNTPNGIGTAAPSATREPSWLANLGDTFEPEISQLKGLAIATLLGIVRDLVTKTVPTPMEQQVGDVIDGITVKLGGQPIRGRLLSEEPFAQRS